MISIGLFRLFSRYTCLIYTAFGYEDFFRVTARLRSHGVTYRTRVYNNDYHSGTYLPRVDNSQYDIFVRPEDEHKALRAIHDR